MAYVAVTKQMRAAVQRRVAQIQQAEFERLKQTLHPYPNDEVRGDEWKEILEEETWGKHLHLMGKIPVDWCQMQGGLTFTLDNNGTPHVLAFQDQIQLPPGFDPHDDGGVTVPASALPPETVAELDRYESAMRSSSDRFVQVGEQLDEFLNRCKSINEALRLMPDLKFYLPEDTVAKVMEKREKDEKTPEQLKGIDADLITSLAVLGHFHEGEE